MTPGDLEAVARRFVQEVFNDRNIAYAQELFAEDLVEHPGSTPLVPAGKVGAIERIRRFVDASDDLRAEVVDVISDGRHVAIRARYKGTDTGGVFPGAPATGRAFDVEGIDVAVADENGRFVEHDAIVDMRAAMEQLGLVSRKASE